MGLRVLVVEDDAALNDIVCTCLTQEGYACTAAFSGSEARMLLERCGTVDDAAFDLVVTDLMLPGCPGEELVPLVRAQLGNVPVIVTSAKGAVSDRVALLRCGADDYLVKPFDLDELLARIAAQLRIRAARTATLGSRCEVPAAHDARAAGRTVATGDRNGLGASGSHGDGASRPAAARDTVRAGTASGSPAAPDAGGAPGGWVGGLSAAGGIGGAREATDAAYSARVSDGFGASAATAPLVFGAWQLDLDRRVFSVGGAPVRLTRTEFDIATALMARPDKVFTKRELYLAACHDDFARADAVAGAAMVTAADERALTTHVGNLRAKLKATGTDGYLETVWGIGFKLRAPKPCGGA